MIDKAIGPLAGAVFGYYNLPVYGRVVYNEIQGKIIKYNKEDEFWRDAIGPYFYKPSPRKLYDGQLVALNNFEITEWFPRCPGLFWTEDGNKYRKRALDFIDRRTDKFILFSPRGKTLMVLGGRGTTRLEAHLGNYDYRILCATSSGRSDAGIPLVVSRGVYEDLRNELQSCGSICANLKGFYSPLPFYHDEFILEAPGIELPANLKSWLGNSLHIPRYCLKVDSRLSIKTKKTESDIQATAWTLFEPKEALLPYSFAFWSFNPRNEASIKDATEEIKNYIEHHGTGEILTDFDERIPRFVSKCPLSTVMDSQTDTSSQQKIIIKDIIKKAEELQGIDIY